MRHCLKHKLKAKWLGCDSSGTVLPSKQETLNSIPSTAINICVYIYVYIHTLLIIVTILCNRSLRVHKFQLDDYFPYVKKWAREKNCKQYNPKHEQGTRNSDNTHTHTHTHTHPADWLKQTWPMSCWLWVIVSSVAQRKLLVTLMLPFFRDSWSLYLIYCCVLPTQGILC
jgi:hypothetical protein